MYCLLINNSFYHPEIKFSLQNGETRIWNEILSIFNYHSHELGCLRIISTDNGFRLFFEWKVREDFLP